MIQINGYFYNGKHSQRISAKVSFFETGQVILILENNQLQTSFDEIRIMPRIANTPRCLYFPDGSKFETHDNAALDNVCALFETGIWHRLIHKIESHIAYVLIAAVAALFLTGFVIEYGIPYAAKSVAPKIPYSVERDAGISSLETLDHNFFFKSQLSETQITRLNKQFQSLADAIAPNLPYQLLFRSCPDLGANAFTLPGGFIIVTDDLVHLAENEKQILAVMAHELGHVYHRHVMRSFLQNSVTVLLLAGLLGDFSSISSFAATFPVFLLQNHYSHTFELEADRFAIDALQQSKIPIKEFAVILFLLGKQNPSDANDFSYLSTHPSTRERIDVIEKFAEMH